jgi:hypothetical protein
MDSTDAELWMRHRFKYFEQTRISVLEQEGDFEWWLCMDGRTPSGWFNKLLTDPRMHVTSDHPKDFRSKGWTITTRLDNDDIYLPGAVKKIQETFSMQELVLDLHYLQFADGKLYTSERVQPNGPFLSLIEDGAERTCYARPHSNMLEDFKSVFVSRDPYALMVIHDRNLGNRIVGTEVDFKGLPRETRQFIKRFM